MIERKRIYGEFAKNLCVELKYGIKEGVRLAESLHLSVLAEYVETEEEKEALHEIGCDLYQGYLYSPAVFL